jgi:CRP/FNR family transcriptional regulator, cyclic AMP receptor protein
MALTTIEKVLFLRQIPFFKDVEYEKIAQIAPLVKEIRFEKDTEFITQGEKGDCLYIIVDGEVKISINGKILDKIMQSMDVIGELAVLTDKPRAAACIASTDVLTLKIDKEDFWNMMKIEPEIAFGVIQILLQYIFKE